MGTYTGTSHDMNYTTQHDENNHMALRYLAEGIVKLMGHGHRAINNITGLHKALDDADFDMRSLHKDEAHLRWVIKFQFINNTELTIMVIDPLYAYVYLAYAKAHWFHAVRAAFVEKHIPHPDMDGHNHVFHSVVHKWDENTSVMYSREKMALIKFLKAEGYDTIEDRADVRTMLDQMDDADNIVGLVAHGFETTSTISADPPVAPSDDEHFSRELERLEALATGPSPEECPFCNFPQDVGTCVHPEGTAPKPGWDKVETSVEDDDEAIKI